MTDTFRETSPMPPVDGASDFDLSPEFAADFLASSGAALRFLQQRGHPDPENCIGDLYLRVARQGRPDNMAGYIRRAAGWALIDEWRRNGQHIHDLEDDAIETRLEASHPTNFDDRLTIQGVFTALSALDAQPHYKGELNLVDLFAKLFIDDMARKDYADESGIAEGTIKSRVGRARKYLNSLREAGEL